jgi:hypothetical protein
MADPVTFATPDAAEKRAEPELLSYQLLLASGPDQPFEGQHMVRLLRSPLRCELQVPGPNPMWQRGTLRDDVIAYNIHDLTASGEGIATIETADSSPWWPDDDTDYRYGLSVNAAGERSVWLLTGAGPAAGSDPGEDGPLPFPAGTYVLFARRVEPPDLDPLPAAITVGNEDGITVVTLDEEQSEWAVAQDGRVRARFKDDLYLEMRRSAREQPGHKVVLYGIVLQKEKDVNEPTVTGVWGAESGGKTDDES